MGVHLQRATLLFQQERFNLAESELRQELAAEPNNPTAHALLGLCLAERKRYDEATREVQTAVGLAPDNSFPHYVLARILHQRDRPDEAATAIAEAIRLYPDDPDFYSRLAAIRIDQRRWAEALEAAEQGLRLDPEHVGSVNLRAMALVQLGRRVEANRTIEGALARDPNSAVNHTTQGWSLLHGGAVRPALEHFREALRLDPNLDWARTGLVEALKARSPVYGFLLRYFLWMSRLSRRAQWALLIGGMLLLRPFPIIYAVVVLSTWLADPLFTLLLRLDRDGRRALSREEIVSSNWIGGWIVATLAMLLLGLVSGQAAFLIGAFLFGFLLLPVVGVFQCDAGWPRKTMVAYTAVVSALALVGVVVLLVGGQPDAGSETSSGAYVFVAVAFVGAVLGTWLSRLLSAVRPKH